MNLTQEYTALKPYLFRIAYNMTGEVQEAEDIVQEAFEDTLTKKPDNVQNAKAYLTRIVMNKAIDRLARLKKRREQYPAIWLPEPYITESESNNGHDHDILPYAFLHLMEELNPLERAVFILRESFDHDYDDIANLCDITVDNCRQILHRARLKAKQTPGTVAAKRNDTNNRLLQEFLKASLDRDTAKLSEILKQDVLLYSDGGGKVVAARKVLEGIASVGKFIFGVTRKTFNKWAAARKVFVNDEPALLMPDQDGVYMVLIPYFEEGKVVKIFMMRNPDKISLKNVVTK
jgi:RNA polymerase sigma-70 factor, ECF subfamily